MKNNIIVFLALSIIGFGICSCKKTNSTNTKTVTLSSNIVLWNKPLDTIRKYIQGDWKYIKYSGGIVGSGLEVYVNNGELLINGDNMKLWNEGHSLKINNKIIWTNRKCNYFSRNTYFMSFGGAQDWIVNEIKNDTLTTLEDNIDGQSYYFTKN